MFQECLHLDLEMVIPGIVFPDTLHSTTSFGYTLMRGPSWKVNCNQEQNALIGFLKAYTVYKCNVNSNHNQQLTLLHACPVQDGQSVTYGTPTAKSCPTSPTQPNPTQRTGTPLRASYP
jgi:hypothetical protein